MASVRAFLGRNRWEVASTLFPLAADALHWAFFEPLNGALRQLLATPGETAVYLLSGLYLVWLVSLVFVGHLEPEVRLRAVTFEVRVAAGQPGRTSTTRTTWPKILFFYPSLLFGMTWLMLIMQATGMSDGPQENPIVSESFQFGAMLTAVGHFLAHCIIAAVDVTPRHAAGTPGHLAVLVPVVLIGELVLNLATAAWLQFFSPSATDAATLAETSARSGGELVGASLLFLLLFAGPRFTFLARHFTPLALLSGLVFIVWEVWETLDRVAF